MRNKAQGEPAESASLDGPSQGTRQKRRASSFVSDQDECVPHSDDAEQQNLRPKAKRQRKGRRESNRSHSEGLHEAVMLSDSRMDTDVPSSCPEFESDVQSKQVRFSTHETPPIIQLTPPTTSSKKETGVFRYLKTFTGLLTPDSSIKSVQGNSQATPQTTLATPQHTTTDEICSSLITELLSNHREENEALLRVQHRNVLQRFAELETRNERLEEVELQLDIELDKRAHTILELEAEINKLRAAARVSAEDINNHEASISTLKTTVSTLEAIISDNEATISALKALNKEIQTSTDRLELELDTSSRDIAFTEGVLETTQNHLDDISAQLEAESGKSQELSEQLESRDASIVDLKAQLSAARQEANEVRMKLFEVQEQRKLDEESWEETLGNMKQECDEELEKLNEEVAAKNTKINSVMLLVDRLKDHHETALREWYNDGEH